MKKLSETWKQKKPLVGLTRSSDSGVKLANTGTKRLGRVAITASNRSGNATTGFENKLSTAKTSCAGSPGSVDCSISSSFGPDLDADVISAVNSLEAAAYEADRRIDSPVSAQIQSVPHRTPTRQNLQRLGQAGSIPGKRKNARSRRSGASKPSLFGDVGGNYLPHEPFTPTQSPRDKRRKSYETEGEESGRTTQMSLLALSSPKSRLLCPASPSPELGTGSNQLPLRRRKALSSASLPMFNRRLTNASGRGSANVNQHQHEELEGEEEIETDISPVLSAVAKPTSKPIHVETPARTTGTAFSSTETYPLSLSVPEPASSELAKEVYSTQKCNGNQNEALGHPLRLFHPGLPTSAVTVSGVKESRTFRGDHINKAGQNENVPHPMQKSPTVEAKSFSFTKASAVQALAAKKRETEGSRFTRVRSDRRQKESPERALPERAPSPRKSLVASSTKSSIASPTKSSVASSTKSSVASPTKSTIASSTKSSVASPTKSTIASSTKSSIASPTKSTIASSTKPSIASPTKPTISPPTKISKSSTVQGLTSTVSKPPVLSGTRSSKPNLSSEASTTSAAKTSSTSSAQFQTDHDAAHLQAGHKTDVICSISNPRGTEAGRSTESGSHTVPQCSSVQVQETECMDVENVITTESVISSKSKAADQLIGTGLGSQRQSAVSESLLLSSWGLPGPVLEAYHSQGITAMFPWQAECLTTGNVLGGGNLVYSAPTSAGKTMVAELLMLKRVLETRRKALFILPFVSVTREKMVSLQHLYQDAGVHVGGFMGSHSPAGGFRRLDVAVCTIEKGNGLVNRLMEENRIDELGVVVIDELHMVGDSNRGYLLELLLTKICYMAHKSRERSKCPIQVIGMSATLPNLDLLASWLSADLYHTDFRPVPLTEHIKVGTAIYDQAMTKVRDMEVKAAFQGDEEHIIPLCLETIMGGHSVLMFCPTKVWCEKLAEKIAREFHSIMKNPATLAAYTAETGFVKASEMARLPIDQVALRNVLEQLGRSPVGMDPMLGKVIQYGVAYHHAGLTFDERDIVEGAFRQGLVKILIATSTLSSGVNLPARRVIVRSVMFGGRVMDTLAYKQMAGRAGRKGVDTEADALGQPILAKRQSAKPQHQRLPHLPDLLALLFPCPRLAGECVLVCKEGERRMAQRLLSAHLRPVASCLQDVKDGAQLSRSMKRAILEVVVGGVASTPNDVARYVACTLLAASLQPGDESSAALITSCLTFLEDNEFVTLRSVQNADQQEVQKYQPTQLGSAVLASSMSPDEGLAVFAELQKARQCFVLANELHIIYLVTPIYSQEISGNLDWYHFYCMWEKLPPDMRLVAKTVGVEEGFLAKAVAGRVPSKTVAQARAVAVHRRFYTALALHDLVQEVPLLEVAARFNCNKGQLQSLMQSAATFAGMVTVFCARLGWANMELLLSQFQQRLTLGVTRELCDLVRIPLLTGTMARMLFNAGYQTVAAVAHAAPEEVEAIFRKASPFQSTKKQEGESDWETEQRRKARCVWLAGRKGVTELEAASAIIGEAKTIIQQELGLRIDWQSGAEAGASAAADGCEGAEDLSASKTGLQRGKEASSASKTSPLFSSRSSSSSASRRGSPSTGAEPGKATDTAEDSETSPPSSKRKRKSAEGREAWETPAAVSRSTRALPRGSDPRRTGGRGTKAPSVKSPPPSSGGRDAGSRSGPKSSAHSPKDVSFFGQVVVSPPASIRRPPQNAPRGPPGAEVAAGTPNSGGRASASTPTTSFRDIGGVRLFSGRRDSDGAERSAVPRPGANRSDVGAGQMREESDFDRLSSGSSRRASTTSTATKAACGPGVKEGSLEGKPQAPDIVPHAASDGQTCKGSNIHGNPGDGGNGSENMNNNGKMATDRENRHPKSADAMHQAHRKENGSNICNSRLYHCSAARAGHPLNVPHLGSAPSGPGAGVTVTAATNRVDKIPESAQGKAGAAVSSVPDRGEEEDASNCFDDSLILNTQTDNLLLGRLSDSSSVSDKSFENAIASTPLLPSLSAREAGRVVGKLTQPPEENTKHATVPPAAGSPAKEKVTGRASKQSIPDEGSTKVNVSALPAGQPAPELFGERRGVDAITPKQQYELAPPPPPPPSPPRPPPPPAPPSPQLDVDHLTEDMFGSPFVSPCAPSGNQRRLSEAAGSARSKGGTVGEEDTSRNGRDRRQLRGRGDDAATDTRGDSEADASAELIAASNYERLPYAEEGVIGNSSDVSCQGLGISHDAASAGRLVCPDRDPEEREEGGDDPEGPSSAGDLGSKCVAEYDIREDLAIAMNLSESFSAAVSSSVARLSDGAIVGPSARRVKGTTEGCDPDGFSTSFTSSMMEKAFANDSFCDPAKEACPQMPITSGDAASQKERAKECAGERSSPEESSLQSLPARENSKRRDGRDRERNRSASQAKSDRHSHGSASGQSDGEFVPPTPPEETSASASNPCVRRTPLRTCRAKGEASRQLGQAAAGARTEGRTAAGARTEGVTAAGARTEGVTAAGARTEGRTAAGARTEGVTAAGARTEGVTAAGARTEGRTAAGARTEGVTAAGARTEGRRRRSQAPRDKENGRARRESHSSEKTPAAPPSDDAQQRNKPVAQPSHPLQTRCLNLHPGKEAASVTVCSIHPDSHSRVDAGSGAPVEVDDDQLTQGSLCIVDVCANAELFATFVEEWRSQPVYAISVACEKKASPLLLGGGIGGNFMQGNPTVLAESLGACGVEIPGDEDKVIVGLAVSWANHDAYYISFVSENTDASLDDTLAAPPCTQSITRDRTTQTVKEVLRLTEGRRASRTVIAYDSKSVYGVLARGLGAVLGRCQDPQIASWLLDPGAREQTLHSMVTNFLPEALPLLEGIGGGVGYGSLGLSVRNPASGRLRAVAESIIARRLMDHFRSRLMEAGLDTAFTDTEMPSLLTMARMELNGFGFSEEECESQKNLMMGKLSALEQEAYTLAGHPFSLTSTDDIAQILYLELQLPVNGDPSAAKATRTLGPSRRAPRGRQKSTFSTSKDILEKLKAYHRLPGVILEWRRISNALTKHVYPLQKEKAFNGRVAMPRIFSQCQLHTATGRVSMMEPNLQNVPRDFEITLPDVIGESPPATRPGAPGRPCPRAGHSRLQAMRGAAPQAARLSSPSTAQHMAVSMRHAFVPFPGGVILAADYSQLELRVIAHLSGDRKLISILNNDGDVFKMIAAQWKNTLPEAVSTEERQHAKQICYGMLYGIGAKALGEQIDVEENDATVFMESFKAKYTGMRSYLRKTVEQCRENGYVTTITGRRRYLPAIKDAAPHARAQAERQAVNTTVQGSAADIVKAAMNMIDQELVHAFPHTRFPHRHHDAEAGQHRGAFLVLQLHDELIYEVSSSEVTQVARIIKRCMETTTPLAVRLPVKVKVGPSWGRLEDMDV